MRCITCEKISFQIICKTCQKNLLKPSFNKRELTNNFLYIVFIIMMMFKIYYIQNINFMEIEYLKY